MPRRKQLKTKEVQFAMNWQRNARVADKIPRYNFTAAVVADDLLGLTLQDNTTISSGDYCYVVSTVGEPFAIGRIMEFVDAVPDSDTFEGRYSVRLNWLYRPSSIHKKAQNTRELLLTMHSEVVSLDSLRPKVTVVDRHGVEDLEKYIAKPNCFWFDRYWDRYISRFYDVIPSSQVTNIPPELGPIIRSRYKYLIMEPQRTKQLIEAPQFCSVCDFWCSETDSVHCVDCDQFFHRGCTTPPIANPLKGYSWTCGPCALAHATHLEQQRGPDLTMRRKRSPLSAEKQQLKDQKEAEAQAQKAESQRLLDKGYAELRKLLVPECKEIERAIAENSQLELTPSQVRYRIMWPFRYFGVNSNIKDIFDVEDSIHPRAISRVGPKHQAVVQDWPGKPVVYYRKIVPDRPKRGPRSKNVNKEGTRYEPDHLDMSLPWVQEAPAGYIERGSSETSTIMWSPDCPNAEGAEDFLKKTHNYAEAIGIHHTSSNFIDACLYNFMEAPNEQEALTNIGLLTKKSLKEPCFTPKEVEKFEKAVEQHGNNLHEVFKTIKTKSAADVVRFYYLWKKTEGGHRVWDNCQARMSKHFQPAHNEEFMASIRSASDPTLSYSSDMLKKLSKSVYCKFCESQTSREWRAAPHSPVHPEEEAIEALCSRCSRIWYRYAVEWMMPEAVLELYANKHLRARVDPELLEDANGILAEYEKFQQKQQIQQAQQKEETKKQSRATASRKRADDSKKSPAKRRRAVREAKEEALEVDSPEAAEVKREDESPQSSDTGNDEVKSASETDTGLEEDDGDEEVIDNAIIEAESTSAEEDDDNEIKKEEPDDAEFEFDEDADDAGLGSEDPTSEEDEDEEDSNSQEFSRSRDAAYSYTPNYCAVCSQCDPSLVQLTCQICLLSVHAQCYGFVSEPDETVPWYCDCCLNDKDNYADHIYQCDLCPVKLPNYAAWLSGVPTGVPDALKRTWDRKWSHVRCAVWSKGVLFQNSSLLQQVEIYPHTTHECSICRAPGICSSCLLCPAKFHPGCAGFRGFSMGIIFKEAAGGPVVWQGKPGTMEAVVICGAHGEDSENVAGLLPISEIDAETELSAMQTYTMHYKQAPHPLMAANLRKSLLNPENTLETALVIPSSYVDDGIESDPLGFFRPETNVCIDCEVTEAPYWIKYPGGDTRCCICYWKDRKEREGSKSSAEADFQQILENMWKIFDGCVAPPKQPSSSSMRIEDIMS